MAVRPSSTMAASQPVQPPTRPRRETATKPFAKELASRMTKLATKPNTAAGGPSTASLLDFRLPKGALSASSKPGAQFVDANDAGKYAEMINDAAVRYGIDPRLVAAVTRAESGFNPRAMSQAGAKGLMQLMDPTAKALGVKDSFDPQQNVNGGTKFLSEMLDRFDRPELALAAYNAGPGAVAKYGGIPPFQETRTYVDKVMGYQRQMRSA